MAGMSFLMNPPEHEGDGGHDRPEPEVAQVDGVRLRGREVPDERHHADAGEGAPLQARLPLHKHPAGKTLTKGRLVAHLEWEIPSVPPLPV